MRRYQAALRRRARPEPHHRIGAPRERRQLGECLCLHGDHRSEAHVIESHLPDCVRAVRRDVRREEGAIVPGCAGLRPGCAGLQAECVGLQVERIGGGGGEGASFAAAVHW
eukprot:scaffold11639_cov65-Phaeocystis_antarctica.AAC.3